MTALGDLEALLDGSADVVGRLDPVDDRLVGQLDELRAAAASLRERVASTTLDPAGGPDTLSGIAADTRVLADRLGQVATIDPQVLVRPFTSEAVNMLPRVIEPTDYFTPSALALLLQHLAVHVRGVVPRARPSQWPLRAAAGRSHVVDGDPHRQGHRVPGGGNGGGRRAPRRRRRRPGRAPRR